MIKFGEHSFEFLVSSGALGFDGLGWPWEYPLRWAGIIDPKAFVVVAKTVTAYPRKGNLSLLSPWTCVRPLKAMGTTNAVGLTNPGIVRWITEYLPRAISKGYNIIPSIKPENMKETCHIMRIINKYYFHFIEINISCPNVDHVPDEIPEMLHRIRMGLNRVILKISLDQVNSNFIDEVDKYVDGYHAINTIPWDMMYPDQKSPIEKHRHGLKGGVSGPPIHWHAIEAVIRLKTMTRKPIIGGGGIFSLDEVKNFQSAGADAFSFGTCFLHRPWRPNQIVKQYYEQA